jgi:hypothetical protein
LVCKSWLHIQGREFLIEELPLPDIADELDTLPVSTNSSAVSSLITHHSSLASAISSLATHHLSLTKHTSQIQIAFSQTGGASVLASRKQGVVLDYNEIDDSQTDFTFESDTTYFIGGEVYVSGTVTFEGGTVIKFMEDDSGELGCGGGVVCDTTAYSPAIFTSENDNSVGDTLPWSSGSPAEGGYTYLGVGSSTELDHCRFYYAGSAVANGSIFDDCQFFDCFYGIVSGNVEVKNSLVVGCYYFMDNSAVCENDTFDNDFCAADSDCWFTNCVFSSVSSAVYDFYDQGAAAYGSYNAFYDTDEFGDNTASFDGNYQSGPLGNYYLSSDSACIDAGNVTADEAGLYWFTTQTSQTIEGTSPVDLGYHYPALDEDNNPVDTDDDGTPDYLQDANGNGLPDDWEMGYFGNLNQYASELDPLGNTLWYDYTNDVNLSIVQFTVRLGNSHFNTTNATGNYLILSGVPGEEAVLINTNDFNDAVWQPYDGNITMNLGPTDGVYQVWIGLKPLATNTSPVWFGTDVYLDRVAPTLNITSPITSTTAVPVLQLQGWSPEELKSVSFDLSNAVVIITNQSGSLTGNDFDTNWNFATNHFAGWDIPLTNGLNVIMLC